MGHGDAMLLQHRRVADAGELEKLGRADGAGSEDHLAARGDPPWRAALAEVETGDAPPVEHQRLGLRLGQHGEVWALQGRAQERLGARPAQAAPLVPLEIAAALVVAPVEVLGRRDPAFGPPCPKGIQDLPRPALPPPTPLAPASRSATP